MEDRPQDSLSSRPVKPGLQALIRDKRRWSSAPVSADSELGFRGWHERGYLPHRDEPGLIQFLSFRLADAFPAVLRTEWTGLLAVDDNHERRRRLEAYLDLGRGECHLRRPMLAGLVQEAFLFGHPRRYDLLAWVVMPNHVHVMLRLRTVPLSEIVRAWKASTARQSNALLDRSGAFWQEDYWDTYIRNERHANKARHYIEANPVKAGLVHERREWAWSSARFRDDFERLRI